MQQVSPSFILDLTSRFLTKILEKDSNYSFYLKEWNSFRQLICDKPHDLAQALTFISQLNSPSMQAPVKEVNLKLLDLVNLKSTKSRDLTPIITRTETHLVSRPAEAESNVLKARKALFNKGRSFTHFAKYSVPSSPTDEKRVQNQTPRSRIVVNTPRKMTVNLENLERAAPPKGYPPIRGFSCKSYRALELPQDNIPKEDLLKSKEKDSGKKYDLKFLARQAKKLNENITEHSENFERFVNAKNKVKKEEKDYQERLIMKSPLKVYGGCKGF